MSKKTIIIVAVILAAVLIAAAAGYKALTTRPADDSKKAGETVAYSPKPEEESPKEEKTEEQETLPEDNPAEQPEETAASSTDQETADSSAETEDVLAPDFTVYTMDGTEVKLSDFRGKPVIVNFWASWCPPCKAELPDFNDAFKEYGDQIEFLMVNLTDGSRETQPIVSAFLLQTGYTFPVYLDLESSAAYAYELYSIPVTVAIDEEGQIKSKQIGSMSMDRIQNIIEDLL